MASLKSNILNRIMSKKDADARLQFIKYFMTGAIAAALDISFFMIFVNVFLLDYRIAIFLGFTFGTLANFALCNAFVFDRKSLTIINSCARHYVSSLGGLVTNEIVVIYLVEFIGFGLLISKIIATFAAFVVNFALIKYFAFNGDCRMNNILKRSDVVRSI